MSCQGCFFPCTTSLLVLIAILTSLPLRTVAVVQDCAGKSGECHDPVAALRLKVIAIFAILATSVIGICLPLVSKSVPALSADGRIFVIAKAFSSGVILETGYMHVLRDSFDDLRSACLPENPWHMFPFTTFVAMVSAVLTLMVDSFATSLHERVKGTEVGASEMVRVIGGDEEAMGGRKEKEEKDGKLMRNRIVAQAQYKMKAKAVMVFFFSITTPFGVALGIGLSNVYSSSSPTALIVEGLLNYTALVDLLAADFMGPKLQKNLKLQFWAYVAVFLGAGGTVMAKWA